MSQLPSGTVTFLFTDIEGSTKIAQQFPEQWETLRARHHAILHQAVQAHNGHVFQIIGDAFCVAFHTATDALKAAVLAQRLLSQEPWSPAPIRIRIGINTGTAQVSGDDPRSGGYTGYTSLARVQRVMSVAHGGQILLSNASAELARVELPDEVGLRDMGEHRLKGLLNPERLWQVVALGLAQDFPPLASLNAIPNNLPIQLTSFIGREKEIGELTDRINRVRLLTLTGAGGAGKTRLALQIAAEVLDGFKDGVWFIDLAPLSDPALVPQAIAAVWELREEHGRTHEQVLQDFLASKTLLVLLDNCEHLIDGCARLADMVLRAAPRTKLLVTSREPFGIAGETTYPVPTLGVPDTQHLPPLDSLSQYEAVRLFIDRSVAVQPSFAVTNANAPAVAQICYRLDGIPLAIELAAARVRALSVEQIAARLDDRFRLLASGSRTALPRQRTLRGTIDWSYDLLSDDERDLLQCLSIFDGGWTLEAAEAVCCQEPGEGECMSVLERLSLLVDKSLVILEQRGGETRYRMLETIRQYASEKLDEAGETSQARDRHLDFFRHLAGQAEPRIVSSEQLSWLNRLESEHDNLRAALDWALHDKPEQALELCGALWLFWFLRGYFYEGRHSVERALEAAAAMTVSAMVEAKALNVAASFALFQDDYARAKGLSEQSLALSRRLDYRRGVALALHHLGLVALSASQHEHAQHLLVEGLMIARQTEDSWLVTILLDDLANVALGLGNTTRAIELLEEQLSLDRARGDLWAMGFALANLADAARQQGDYARTLSLVEESLALWQQVKDKLGLAGGLRLLGEIARRQGDYARAGRALSEALRVLQQLGTKRDAANGLGECARLALASGKPESAARLFGAAQALFESTGAVLNPADRAEYDRCLANIRAQLDEATVNAAWAEGRAMTLEQAIEYALMESREPTL